MLQRQGVAIVAAFHGRIKKIHVSSAKAKLVASNGRSDVMQPVKARWRYTVIRGVITGD